MPNYRRAFMPGGTWFFTANLLPRHYWEHVIPNDADFQRDVDYVHVNPLKHGYVKRVADWPYSTFHRYVTKGIYPADWCGNINSVVGGDE